MTKYEITIITKEDLKDAPVKKEIESLDGKILNVTGVGQKQMTFPIKKETTGYYTSVEFEIEPEKVLELNKKLSLKNEILRFLIITTKAIKVEPAKESLDDARDKKPAKTEIEKAPEVLPEVKKEVEIPEVTEAVEKIEEVAEKPKEKEKPVKKAETVKPAAKPKKAIKEEPKEKTESFDAAQDKEISTEDRLKALDEKLDELLKE